MTEIKTSLIFDPEKFMVGYSSSTYNIDYEIFKSDIDTSKMSTVKVHRLCKQRIKKERQSCFSAFHDAYDSYTESGGIPPNRIRFFCNRRKHSSENVHLSIDEVTLWVELCKQNKIMPDNVGENFIENDIYDINFEDISLNMKYIYLCAARYVQEEPYFVRGVMHLVQDLKLGFFTAFCVASYYQMTNASHHIIPVSRDYRATCRPKEINNPKKDGFGKEFDLIHVPRLFNFLNGGDIGEPIKKLKALRYGSYSLHDRIKRYWTGDHSMFYKVSREKLADTELESVLKAGKF